MKSKKINQSLKNMEILTLFQTKKMPISSIFCEIRCSVGINSLSTLHQNLKQITSVIWILLLYVYDSLFGKKNHLKSYIFV